MAKRLHLLCPNCSQGFYAKSEHIFLEIYTETPEVNRYTIRCPKCYHHHANYFRKVEDPKFISLLKGVMTPEELAVQIEAFAPEEVCEEYLLIFPGEDLLPRVPLSYEEELMCKKFSAHLTLTYGPEDFDLRMGDAT